MESRIGLLLFNSIINSCFTYSIETSVSGIAIELTIWIENGVYVHTKKFYSVFWPHSDAELRSNAQWVELWTYVENGHHIFHSFEWLHQGGERRCFFEVYQKEYPGQLPSNLLDIPLPVSIYLYIAGHVFIWWNARACERVIISFGPKEQGQRNIINQKLYFGSISYDLLYISNLCRNVPSLNYTTCLFHLFQIHLKVIHDDISNII